MLISYPTRPLHCKRKLHTSILKASVYYNKRNATPLPQVCVKHVLSMQENSPSSVLLPQHVRRLHQDVSPDFLQLPRPHRLSLTSRCSSIEKEMEKDPDDNICKELSKLTTTHDLLENIAKHEMLTPLQTYVAANKLLETSYDALQKQYSWLQKNDGVAYVQLLCNGNLHGEFYSKSLVQIHNTRCLSPVRWLCL